MQIRQKIISRIAAVKTPLAVLIYRDAERAVLWVDAELAPPKRYAEARALREGGMVLLVYVVFCLTRPVLVPIQQLKTDENCIGPACR